MKDLPPLYGRVLSVLVVWTVAISAFMALVAMQPTAKATQCSQSDVTIGGDWTVVGTEVCEGTMYTMTGDLLVPLGASLTLKDGGIQFAQTPATTFSVTVQGTLTLDNAMITVTGDTIDPYLAFQFTSSGTLNVSAGSILAFPGSLATTGGRFVLDHSSIKALNPTDVARWTATVDEYDDAPAMTFTNTAVRLYDSGIYDLFEKLTVDSRRQVSLTGSTSFIAINSYVGIDLLNETTNAAKHNTLAVGAGAGAYLMWCTIDESQRPDNTYDYSDAINVTGGGQAFIYRRADVSVIDMNGAPVDSALLRMTYTGTATDATYPDNGGATSPNADVVAYLGRAPPLNWKQTIAGAATIPLVSDAILSTGSSFRGNYNISTTHLGYFATQQVGLAHWPLADDAANAVSVTLQLGLQQLLPDLRPGSMTYLPTSPRIGETVTIDINVTNAGQGPAGRFWVRIYDNILLPTSLMYEQEIMSLAAGLSFNLYQFTWSFASSGSQSIRVIVDPLNTVYEGAPGSASEMNNEGAFPLVVSPLLPDLQVVVNAVSGLVGSPVDLTATVTNGGGVNATGVVVDFSIDIKSNKIGTVNIPGTVPYGGSIDATFSWTPPTTGTYTVWAVVDPANIINEYDDGNNEGFNTLTVNPAPNPVVYPEDLRASDPFPEVGDSISFTAVVRNIGQADITSNFDVDFSIDAGPPLETVTITASPAAPMRVGDTRLVTTASSYLLGGCGYHTLDVKVDSGNAISEGSAYEADNTASRTLQVFRNIPVPIVYSGSYALTYLPVAQNIEIAGSMTITDGSIVVTQPQEACGRVFIKVTGTLTLVNSTIGARNDENWPVVVYVGTGGKIIASDGSKLLLNTKQGIGILEVGSTGTLQLTDTTADADLNVHGGSSFFNRVEFQGESLAVNTNGLARIWDPIFDGTTTLALRSEDGNLGTVDVDVRNATLDAILTSQFVFGGHQYVHLTSVVTTKVARWWEGTITQKAKVTRFWWLTVEAVDGTGAVLRPDANTNISLYRMNMVSLRNENLLNPTPGSDMFGTNSTSWPVNAPQGSILYKASAEERFASVEAQYMNATYTASGNATINGTRYIPDKQITLMLDDDTTFRLTFSRLTPDLSVKSITFSGDNGGTNQQPINRIMTVSAIIGNAGEIDVPSVKVNFFFQDVDANGDHLMDLTNASYSSTFIGQTEVSVPLNGTAVATVTWDRPQGGFEITYVISVVVDPPIGSPSDGGAVKETNEFNNIGKTTLSLFTWPDFHIEASQVQIPTAIQGNEVTITADITNAGTNDGTGVYVSLTVNGVPITPTSSVFTVARGGIATAVLRWTPQNTGAHDLLFTVANSGGLRNTDYNIVDNSVTMQVDVQSPPDLALLASDFDPSYSMTQRSHVTIPVKIYNLGDTPANGFVAGIYYARVGVWPPSVDDRVAYAANLNVTEQSNITVDMVVSSITAIEVPGSYQLTVWVDTEADIGEVTEANNAVDITLDVEEPIGEIVLSTSPDGQKFEPGDKFTAVGLIQSTDNQEPIPNLYVNMTLRKHGEAVPLFMMMTLSADNGYFSYVNIEIPSTASDGTYDIEFTSQSGISAKTISITIEIPQEPKFFGLPWWMFLMIIIIIVVVIVAVIIYTKKVGLGKLVECGECGAFIPEDSVKCPKCGVEFEKDMAKCSNCQAWIPLDVKQCPECKVEFATGEVEMADYEQKMRAQYNEVKKKFREQAQAEIGRPLSDDEFEAWWKRQPSFLTFEDWLRDEEEMRKMGSKPCPSCGTLNSINATVCHKCGTLLKKEEPRKRPPPKEEKKEPARIEQAPQPTEPLPAEPVPKKVVVKKPITPVVQKKVVVRRPEEGQEGAAEGGGTSSEEEI